MSGKIERGTAWEAPAGKLNAAQTKLWNELGGRGLGIVERLDTDDFYRRAVAEFMMRVGSGDSLNQRVARAIMGDERFWGFDEWADLYGVGFSVEQILAISEFPWGDNILSGPCPFHEGKLVKDTHFAFLGIDSIDGKPLTIMKWRQLLNALAQPRIWLDDGKVYHNEQFVLSATCSFQWYLMLVERVPHSENKPYRDQKNMLPGDYVVPRAVEEVTKALLFYLKSGVYIHPDSYVRCEDGATSGARAHIGYFDESGLAVSYKWGGYPLSDVGVSASRKLPS